jgi:hypothetical protein
MIGGKNDLIKAEDILKGYWQGQKNRNPDLQGIDEGSSLSSGMFPV